jgi:hypothetical protein
VSENANYRIIQTVASGGTAVLYKAIQVSLDRVVDQAAAPAPHHG